MKKTAILILFLFVANTLPLYAEDLQGNVFIVRNPLLTAGGQQLTGSSFRYFSGTTQTGSAFFPTGSTPTVVAIPGNGKVDLTWTSSVGSVATANNYEVGTSTISGGPYVFESVGNVLSFSKTSLTNGIPYYFKIKAEQGSLVLAQSLQVTATPSGTTNNGGGGGGGGAVISPSGGGGVNFSGRAYPSSKIFILKDGQLVATTVADPNADFNVQVNSLSTGNYVFSVYGQDNKLQDSIMSNFNLYVTQGVTITVGSLFIAPTISVDKTEVKQGDNVAILGQAAPNSQVTIAVNSNQAFFNQVLADKNGSYLYNFDTSVLEFGQHKTKAKAALIDTLSQFGKSVFFEVGDITSFIKPGTPSQGDFNQDGRTNIVDFSILMYWYHKPLTPDFKILKQQLLGNDGPVTPKDFSILMYHWTG